MTEQTLPALAPRESPAGPRVSVVMPTFRRAHQIGDAIRSLLAQTLGDFELLVRDDGDGTDGTREAVLAAAAGDPRVSYHRNPAPLRMPGNLNGGIEASRGEVIAVCHDHDLYRPDFLEEMVGALDRNPSALFVHTAIEVISQAGEPVVAHVGRWPELTPGGEWLRFMLQGLNCPVCALTLVRRSAHERYGLYNPADGFISDIEMWMRLARHGDVAYVGRPLIQVREREVGHHASANAVPLTYTVARIHRRYLPVAHVALGRLVRRLGLEVRVIRTVGRIRASQLVGRIRAGARRAGSAGNGGRDSLPQQR